MLNNRKVFIYLIQQSKPPITQRKAQFLMFLAMQKSPTTHYHFIPTEQGPLSLVLEDDRIALLKKGLLVQHEQKNSSEQILAIKADLYDEKMLPKDEDKQLINSILDASQTNNVEELLKTAITMKPFYGIHLRETTISLLDTHTRSKITEIQKTLKGAKRALYTIGYEKISLDEFVLFLLAHGIQSVLDVRETTTSRRREFSKNPLELALNKAKIDYISMPEVGIPSEVRKMILEKGDHQDLLVWYRTSEEHTNKKYTSKVANLVREGNTALMCYEKDPKECHRSVFALFCKESHPEIPAIVHLREIEEPLLVSLL